MHTEWSDQIILNYNTKFCFRLDKINENGPFEEQDNKIIINWSNWGKETFYKIDNYTYSSRDIYEIYLQSLKKIKKVEPIYIFYHICCIDNWKEIYTEQMNTIKESGLYDKVEYIFVGILGNFEKEYFNDPKIKILYTDKRTELYEIQTINFIKNFTLDQNLFKNQEAYILYIHTKGVRNAGNKDCVTSWRKMMEYFLIEKYENCIQFLDEYDTLGCNIVNQECFDIEKVRVNKSHSLHYSGNFWWSKKSYIQKLPNLEIDLSPDSINTRYRAENWILSQYPNAKVGVLFQDNTNFHPYFDYIFNYYKEMEFFVKQL
jgi:hypothetical protein